VSDRAGRRIASRASWLLVPTAGACLSVACGDGEEKQTAPISSTEAASGAGRGGATGAGGAGMGGSESAATGATSTQASSGGGGGGAACVGCGEYLTTSDAMAQLCDGAAPLWEDWTSCACVACAQTCGAMCELPPNPACSTCRVEVAYGACAEPYQSCANDL
jgi:hypothetical protein